MFQKASGIEKVCAEKRIPRAGDTRMLKLGRFAYRGSLCIKSGYHASLSRIFCPTVSKVFMGNFFVYQKNSGHENKLYIKGPYRPFLSIFFVSQWQNLSSGSPVVFQKVSCIKKVYA